MANKKSTAGSKTHPMVGVKPPGGDVKQPIRGRNVVSGTRISNKVSTKGLKTIKTANGTSGIMRPGVNRYLTTRLEQEMATTARRGRTAAQKRAAIENLKKARIARSRNSAKGKASARTARFIARSSDKDLRKGRFGTGKSTKESLAAAKKRGGAKAVAEQKSWDKDRYNSQKITSITGSPYARSTKLSPAAKKVAAKLGGKPVFKKKRRRRVTATKK